MPQTPQELLKQGMPREALAALQALVRAQPQDAKLRVFLFQLLAVLGDWERALAFVLSLLGHDDVAVYDGGWAEWGNRLDLPVDR